jgi:putative restriction endonuclease
MKYFVAITDNNWFSFLASQRPDEVNFWRPSSTQAFKAIDVGAPFLFKLHSPDNYIVGGGFLVQHSILPLSLAWKAFETKNGAADLETFRDLVNRHRPKRDFDPMIGCTILAEPFFLDRDSWIPVPKDWANPIVSGKKYDSEEGAGKILWQQVEERMCSVVSAQPWIVAEGPRYGQEYLTRGRLGQGAFRILVTDAYQRSCCMTGERTLPVLEAAHIKPFTKDGPNTIDNGLLLRSDLHTLFDGGYMTITTDYHIEVSPLIREKFHNGKDYYKMHGQQLAVLPVQEFYRPSREFLEWHNSERFAV